MNHNDIRHMLSDYIDGVLLPGDRIAIEEHLKTCAKCSDALKELRQTVELVRSVEEVDPPAWMKQKIMTQVRDEAAKKSWFRRFFFPLQIKLPLEAIGVLFIAVTALFIYQNTQSDMKASKQQMAEQMPGKELMLDGMAKDGEPKTAVSSIRSMEMPPLPGDKALAMKSDYQQPALPTLQDQVAAPAPVHAEKRQASLASGENSQDFLKKEDTSRGGSIPERTLDSSSTAPGPTGKAKAAAPPVPFAGAVSADKPAQTVIIRVMDLEAGVKEVEKAITQVDGLIVRREIEGSKAIVVVTIKTTRVNELRNKLKLLGETTEPSGGVGELQELVKLRIELLPRSAPR